MKKQTQYIVIAAAAVLSAIAGFWLAGVITRGPADADKPAIQGFVLDVPRKIGVPGLIKGDGSVFSRADLAGRWNLLFFGYTNCPDICPTTLNTVAVAKKRAGDFPQVVFISVDPGRDDAAMVDEYARYFDEDFIGVTGEEKLLQGMAAQMSVMASVLPESESGEYLVDHSANLLLLDPDVKLVAMLKPPHTVDSISKGLDAVYGNDRIR